MNQDSLISIIVPVYNAELYLKECIESVLKQGDHSWELVLIDDGSIDNSAKICRSYFSNKRIVFIQKENTGVADSRKIGIKKSKGDYILFLDADDCLPDNTLAQYRKYLTPDIDVIATQRFHNITSNGTIQYAKGIPRGSIYPSVDEALKSALLGKYLSSVWGGLYRKELLLNDYAMPKLKIGEDLSLNLNVILYYQPKIQVIEDPLYYYRENLLSAMRHQNEHRMEAVMDLITYLSQFTKGNHLYERLKKEYAFRMVLLWSTFVFNNYEKYRFNKTLRKKMKKYYLKSFKYLYPYLKFYLFLDFVSPYWFNKVKCIR